MDWLAALGVALLAYLLGSFPSAYLLVRLLKGADVREVGTRNVGTLNTYYQVGKWGALLVLAADVGKGAVAVLLPGWMDAPSGSVYLAAPLVVAGHNWPVFLKFRGGKGAATVMGVSLALLPLLSLVALVPAVLTGLLFRNVVIGALAGYVIFNALIVATGRGGATIGLFLGLAGLNMVAYGWAHRRKLYTALQQRDWRGMFYGNE